METCTNTLLTKRTKTLLLAVICLLLTGCTGKSTLSQDTKTDQYFLKWALPDNELACTLISEETLEAFNAKLEADGYSFGLQFVTYQTGDSGADLDSETILEELNACGADIATVSTDGRKKIAEKAQEAGLFIPLDTLLKESSFYDAFPRLCWESVRHQDSICYIPNEYYIDEGLHLCVRQGQLPDRFPQQFGGSLLELDSYLSADAPMYYVDFDFNFAEAFGYAFDSARGVLVADDGTCCNPLDDEQIVAWLRMVNRWYQEEKVQMEYKKQEDCAVTLRSMYPQDGWEDYYVWKGYAFHRAALPTGILATSDRKEEAFTFLELLHTDHSYGDLLVYGAQALDAGGPEDRMYHFVQSCLGLDTGLRWDGNWGTNYFSNGEEKKQYYEEHILPSPSLYMDFPEECSKLVDIEYKYMKPETDAKGNILPETSILTCDDFDAMLEKFREELEGSMDEVLGKLAQNP